VEKFVLRLANLSLGKVKLLFAVSFYTKLQTSSAYWRADKCLYRCACAYHWIFWHSYSFSAI